MRKYTVVLISLVMLLLCLSGCFSVNTKELDDEKEPDKKQESLEDRDYVVSLKIEESENKENRKTFTFKVADLSDYKGASKKNMKTEMYATPAYDLAEALEYYYEEKGRAADLGHLEEMSIQATEEEFYKIITEMSEQPELSKAVKVSVITENDKYEDTLRNLIKAAFEGEN